MPVPSPKSGESKSDFISRCMGSDSMQEYDQEQRAAICYSKFKKKEKGMDPILRNVYKTIDQVKKQLKKAEKEEAREQLLGEIPIESLDLFSDEGQEKFKELYCNNRIAGKSKEDSLVLSTRLVARSDKANKENILKAVHHELEKLRSIKIEKAKDEDVDQNPDEMM